MSEHKQALKDLVDALDRVMPTLDSLASFAFVHGIKYPPEVISIEKELKAARDLLKKDSENNG
jgi:hypothetical protein